MTGLIDRREVFRLAIASFIEARREAKLKGKEDDADTASKYDYATWLADAAREWFADVAADSTAMRVPRLAVGRAAKVSSSRAARRRLS